MIRYSVVFNEEERELVRSALLQMRERTPATGVRAGDWLEKDTIDGALEGLKEAREITKG